MRSLNQLDTWQNRQTFLRRFRTSGDQIGLSTDHLSRFYALLRTLEPSAKCAILFKLDENGIKWRRIRDSPRLRCVLSTARRVLSIPHFNCAATIKTIKLRGQKPFQAPSGCLSGNAGSSILDVSTIKWGKFRDSSQLRCVLSTTLRVVSIPHLGCRG